MNSKVSQPVLRDTKGNIALEIHLMSFRAFDKRTPKVYRRKTHSPILIKGSSIIGSYLFASLIKRDHEQARTATRREHFACQGSAVSQIFIPVISNGEKILSNANVVV